MIYYILKPVADAVVKKMEQFYFLPFVKGHYNRSFSQDPYKIDININMSQKADFSVECDKNEITENQFYDC